MVQDVPPQQEVVADNNFSQKQDTTALNWNDFVEQYNQIQTNDTPDIPHQTTQDDKTNLQRPKRSDGRIVINLDKKSHRFTGLSHITGVSHTGGYSSSSTHNYRQTTRTSHTSQTAQETINNYSARMNIIAQKPAIETELSQYVDLYNFYTHGVVAINPDGTEAYSEKGNEAQIANIKKKAEERAKAILANKNKLVKFEIASIDAFAQLLPDNMRNEFLAGKNIIAKNAVSMFAESQKQSTNSGNWFKRLFSKSNSKKEKQQITASNTTQSEKKSWFAKLFSKKHKTKNDLTTSEKPWYETFEFDTEKPMVSIQQWCEKVGAKKMSQDEYLAAQNKIPEEYRKAASRIGVWYRNTKDRKDFDWNKLPTNRLKEFTTAKDKYAENLAAKRSVIAQTTHHSSNTTLRDGFAKIRADQAARRVRREKGFLR